VPLEPHRRETANGPLDEQFAVADGAQGAQGEWFEINARPHEWCGLQLDKRSPLQRRERVESRRRRRQGVLVLNASEIDRFETLYLSISPRRSASQVLGAAKTRS
jgi:hypothetical protein